MRKPFVKTDHALIDALLAELKDRNGRAVRTNDATLCRLLHVSPSMVSNIRQGKMEVSDQFRVAVMREFRWPLRRLDELAPPAKVKS